MNARRSREQQRQLRRAERAVDRLPCMTRKVFLAIRVEELAYSQIAARFGISVADVERHFAVALRVLAKAMDEKDPWWWRFRRW
jgi:DNA-directed RNA polymerase specialized sigma24 family protein